MTPFPPDQIGKGAALYKSHCEACHGVRMRGTEWAVPLDKFPREDRGRFIDTVTYGRRAMPPWDDVLKREDVEALWAYVAAGERKN